MFHVELREFPHNFCRFNLSEAELRSLIIDPWARRERIEIGERRWDPSQAKLIVLDGPQLSPSQLTMGRGWRNAQRGSRDVTMQVLSEARASTRTTSTQSSDVTQQSDSLALEILADLAGRRVPLYRAWELALTRSEQSPSRALALAEDAVISLLRSGLLLLMTEMPDKDEEPRKVDVEDEQRAILESPASWAPHALRTTVWIMRS